MGESAPRAGDRREDLDREESRLDKERSPGLGVHACKSCTLVAEAGG